jgi:hypothetical protein
LFSAHLGSERLFSAHLGGGRQAAGNPPYSLSYTPAPNIDNRQGLLLLSARSGRGCRTDP